jgi:hypothetical protein
MPMSFESIVEPINLSVNIYTPFLRTFEFSFVCLANKGEHMFLIILLDYFKQEHVSLPY